MNNNLESIYLDQAGYEDYIERINFLEKKLKEFKETSRVAAQSILSDDRYITHESSELVRKEKAILEELKDLRDKQYRIKMIEKHGDETRVDIGDTLQIEIMYAPNDLEEITVELTATIGASFNEQNKVSINSPLGRAIFNAPIGGICSYKVDERRISVHIIKKLILEDQPIERK